MSTTKLSNMEKKTVVRCDASVNPNKGVGLGYEATIYNGDGSYEKVTDSKFIDDKTIKTTDAETVAAAFAVKEVYEHLGKERGDYSLKLKSDCEHTVHDVRSSVETQDAKQRVLQFFANGFEDVTVQWISRSANEKVDALATSAMEQGYEENQ